MKTKQVGKKILSGLLTVCLVAGSIVITKPQNADAAGDNLVANGGFDTTADWYAKSGNVEAAMPEQQEVQDVEVTEHFVNGDFEAEVDYSVTWWPEGDVASSVGRATDENSNGVLCVQDLKPSGVVVGRFYPRAGNNYSIKFDIKTTAENSAGKIHLWTRENGGEWKLVQSHIDINGTWTSYPSFSYTPKSEAVEYVEFLFQNNPDGTENISFYIDNFSVTTESPKMTVTEHFTNGDFDAETDYSGIWWPEGDVASSVGRATDENGNGVLCVQDLKSSGVIVGRFYPTVGTTYSITFDVKTTTESSAGKIHLWTREDGGAWTLVQAHIDINGTWTSYPSFSYTPTSETVTYVEFLFQNNPDGTENISFYIDNFSVTTESPKMTVTEHFTNGDFDAETDYSGTWWPEGDVASSVGRATDENGNGVLCVQDLKPSGVVVGRFYPTAGTTYSITFDVKTTTESSAGKIHLWTREDGGAWTLVQAHIDINGTWTSYPSFSYTPTSETVTYVEFLFQNNPDGTENISFYIDDFSITSMETPTTYSEGIGNCLGAEPDNVLAMKEMKEATYKSISLTAGNTYKYSYQVKTDSAATVTFAVGTQTVQTTAATSDWTTVSGKITAEADATDISFVRSGVGNLLIDDVAIYEVEMPDNHTTMEGGGVYIPTGHRNLYTSPHGTFEDAANLGSAFGGNGGAIVDGMAELSINGTKNEWLETGTVSVEAGKEYTFSVYVYVTEASGSLQINMYADGVGAPNGGWTENVLDEANCITGNTNQWQQIKYTWTPTTSGNVVFGIRNHGADDSTATVYIDDFALTTAKDKVYTTISAPGVLAEAEAYRLALAVSNHSDLCTDLGLWNWLDGEILIDGEPMTVGFNLGDDGAITAMYHTANQTAVIPLTATSIEIPAGTEFEVRGDSSKPVLVIENDLKILKLGQGWGEYQKEHEYVVNEGYADAENVRYYNISNGDYLLTSSNNAIEVDENKALTTGSKITVNDLQDTNVFHISRLENEELWKETVVLYIPGDANEDEAISAKDLVAMKWAETKTSEKQNARLAGTYASDLDGNRDVNDIDLRAMRLALVSDDAKAELAVSKSDSLLGGEMPIAGFTVPYDANGADLVNDNLYKLIADAGINSIAWSFDGYDTGVGESADKHMALADKWGLKMWVHDFATDAASTNRFTSENVAEKIGAYSMYESFVGIHIVDEPDLDTNGLFATTPEKVISKFKDDITLFNQITNVSGYMNLLPYYEFLDEDFPNLTANKYQNYLKETFTDTNAEMLSVDYYPIRIEENWSIGNLYVDYRKQNWATNLYQNLDMMRIEANKEANAGKPFWYIAQLGIDAETDKAYDTNLYMTASELQWQINTALAMGARGIQYWPIYAEAEYQNMANAGYMGLVKPDGTKSNYYDQTVAQNSFIQVVDEVLMNATNEGIFVNDSTASTAFSEINSGVVLTDADSDVLKSVSGDNALVGCFDYYGKTAFYVVNCNTETAKNITLTYDNACQVAVTKFTDATLNRTLSEATSSTTISVGAGQAALVIVE